jgi:hypothetical protein
MVVLEVGEAIVLVFSHSEGSWSVWAVGVECMAVYRSSCGVSNRSGRVVDFMKLYVPIYIVQDAHLHDGAEHPSRGRRISSRRVGSTSVTNPHYERLNCGAPIVLTTRLMPRSKLLYHPRSFRNA